MLIIEMIPLGVLKDQLQFIKNFEFIRAKINWNQGGAKPNIVRSLHQQVLGERLLERKGRSKVGNY